MCYHYVCTFFKIVILLIRTVIRSIDYVYSLGPKGLNNLATWKMFTKMFYTDTNFFVLSLVLCV